MAKIWNIQKFQLEELHQFCCHGSSELCVCHRHHLSDCLQTSAGSTIHFYFQVKEELMIQLDGWLTILIIVRIDYCTNIPWRLLRSLQYGVRRIIYHPSTMDWSLPFWKKQRNTSHRRNNMVVSTLWFLQVRAVHSELGESSAERLVQNNDDQAWKQRPWLDCYAIFWHALKSWDLWWNMLMEPKDLAAPQWAWKITQIH